MIENKPFEWDEQKEKAAMWIAVGDLTNDEIAERLDIGVATLYRWKSSHEFKTKVQENLKEIRERVFNAGIADRVQRVRRLNRRWNDIDRLFAARAKDMLDVPGGDTGLLCRDIKGVGSGEDYTTVDVYKSDTGLLREEREIAKQAAIELGQWTEKTATVVIENETILEALTQTLQDVYPDEPNKAMEILAELKSRVSKDGNAR